MATTSRLPSAGAQLRASDLGGGHSDRLDHAGGDHRRLLVQLHGVAGGRLAYGLAYVSHRPGGVGVSAGSALRRGPAMAVRMEGRRVGKLGVSTCRSWWSSEPEKKKR